MAAEVGNHVDAAPRYQDAAYMWCEPLKIWKSDITRSDSDRCIYFQFFRACFNAVRHAFLHPIPHIVSDFRLLISPSKTPKDVTIPTNFSDGQGRR